MRNEAVFDSQSIFHLVYATLADSARVHFFSGTSVFHFHIEHLSASKQQSFVSSTLYTSLPKKSEDEGEKTKKLLIYFVFFHPNYHLSIFAFFLAKNFRIIEKLASANAEERFLLLLLLLLFSEIEKSRTCEQRGSARGRLGRRGNAFLYGLFDIEEQRAMRKKKSKLSRLLWHLFAHNPLSPYSQVLLPSIRG